MTDGRHEAARHALHGAGISAAGVRIPEFSSGHVPATPGHWRSVLLDAGLAELWRKLAAARSHLQELSAAPVATVGRLAPRRAEKVVDLAGRLIANVEGASWFVAPDDSRVNHSMLRDLAATAQEVAADAIEAPLGTNDSPVLCGDRIVSALEEEVWRASAEPPSAIVAEAFGLGSELPEGMSGLDSGARLQVSSGLTASELNALSRETLRHLISANAAYTPSATGILAPLLLCERPLIGHVMALHFRDRLLELDPPLVDEVLAEHRSRLPANWGTHRALVHGLQRLASAGDDAEEEAFAEAELAWLVSEGPVRRSAWTVLRLEGAPPGPVPLLAQLRDRLQAEDTQVAELFATAIEPGWRNSVAHRDASWNASRGELVLDGVGVDPGNLRLRRAVGMGACTGMEVGIALARAASRPLQRVLDLSAPVAEHPQIARARLADLLAGHGLLAQIEIHADRVSIRLEDGTVYTCAQVIGELSAAWRTYGLEIIEIRFADRPPLTVSAKTLATVGRLCRTGKDHSFAPMALWPVISAGRLHDGVDVDLIYEEMAQRAAWNAAKILARVAGNDVGLTRLRAAAAVSELEETLSSLVASWQVLPGRPPTRCADVPQRIRHARTAATSSGNFERLRTVGRSLMAVTPREGPPDLPWFKPLATDTEAEAA